MQCPNCSDQSEKVLKGGWDTHVNYLTTCVGTNTLPELVHNKRMATDCVKGLLYYSPQSKKSDPLSFVIATQK